MQVIRSIIFISFATLLSRTPQRLKHIHFIVNLSHRRIHDGSTHNITLLVSIILRNLHHMFIINSIRLYWENLNRLLLVVGRRTLLVVHFELKSFGHR